MKIGVYVDVHNLYMGLQYKYKRKLDFGKLLKYIQAIGTVNIANVYGVHALGKAVPFITKLQTVGFNTVYRHVRSDKLRLINQNVQMTVDILHDAENLDTVVLCTTDRNLAPLIMALKSRGTRVIVLACHISKALITEVDWAIEIPKSMLETK